LIAVLSLADVLVHSPREPYKFLLRAALLIGSSHYWLAH
jgi:hypothetical protein